MLRNVADEPGEAPINRAPAGAMTGWTGYTPFFQTSLREKNRKVSKIGS
jgi:hypothetical protein